MGNIDWDRINWLYQFGDTINNAPIGMTLWGDQQYSINCWWIRKTLPDGLVVVGNIDMRSSVVGSLPKGLTVHGDIIILNETLDIPECANITGSVIKAR